MPIIGKLLKKTTVISYKRKSKKSREYKNQIRTLFKLIDRAKETNFGKKYNFNDLLLNQKIVSEYKKSVPITNYDSFYDEWLEKSIKGQKNHTWPGKIKYFALSSGTTNLASKKIPVSSQMIRSFQKTSMSQISTLYNLKLSDKTYNSQILVVGGSSNLKKTGNHFEGDLSGILKKKTPLFINPLTKPNKNITKINDWNKKLEKMVIKAPSWDIGAIMGVPSWCILLMEKIIEIYKLNNIHDIWPNLEVYVHGGVFMQPYVTRLERIVGKKVHLLDTYLSSEGYFAYQTSPDKEGMQLLLDSGIFYEFIPFNSDYFDEQGNVKDKYFAYTLNQVELGVDYALVISTNAGLWRYLIGDLVQFVDIEKFEIKITGRIKHFLSICGEHLSLDNINIAVKNVCLKNNIEITEFCLYPDNEKQRHSWYIGTNSIVDQEILIHELDEEIGHLNDDYRTCRKQILKQPIIEVLDPKVFYNFLDKTGKSGSQNKFPRVLNSQQTNTWLKFLKEV